jgi:hypothetical protein
LLLLETVTAVFALPIEVQLRVDPDKPRLWPFVVASLALTHQCPTALVVVTTEPRVARWARGPFSTGHPGFDLCPIVVGPDVFPWITDVEVARRRPHAAILSALMHLSEPGVEHVVVAALEGAASLAGSDADAWRELLLEALRSNEVARQLVEAMMDIENFRDKSVWYREGREEGREAGREEGILREARSAVGRVLERRGLALNEAERRRLETCLDLPSLHRWHDQAVTATTVAEALT